MTVPVSASGWFVQMLRLRPARVPVGHTIRAAIGVGGPFVVGALTGHVMTGMWIGLACLLMAPGEREGSHRLNLRIALISAPIAACGYLLGFAQLAPLWLLVPVMGLLALICGAIPAYGAPFSVAGMQFLLIAAIAIGVRGVDWWVPFWLYFVGAALYLAMMLIEFALDRRRPERIVVHDVLAALSALARARAADLASARHEDPSAPGSATVAAARSTALAAIATARTVQVTGRSRAAGPAAHWNHFAALLDSAESLAAVLVGTRDAAGATAVADRLDALLGGARGVPESASLPQTDSPLGSRLAEIERDGAALGLGFTPPAGAGTAQAAPRSGFALVLSPEPAAGGSWRERLRLGRDARGAALRLGLVYAVAVAGRGYFPFDHWFWIPLTVCLVMKPDFGSVFGRAILRVIGTTIGVVISTGVLWLANLPGLAPHSSLVIGIAITVLAATVPWFMMRSYTLQAVAIAPIVILLVAVIQPHGADTSYGTERIGATVVGGVLVLVLGYALWPSARRADVPGRLQRAGAALGRYLTAAVSQRQEGSGAVVQHEELVRARRETYATLSDLRVQLQRELGEAPTVAAWAGSWVPAVTSVERLADGVAQLAADRLTGDAPVALDPAPALAELAGLAADPDPISVAHRSAALREELLAR